MKFWFRGHHYKTQFKFAASPWHWKALLDGSLHLRDFSWFGHEDDCCDYWLPVDSPAGQRAFMLDDDFALSPQPSKAKERK